MTDSLAADPMEARTRVFAKAASLVGGVALVVAGLATQAAAQEVGPQRGGTVSVWQLSDPPNNQLFPDWSPPADIPANIVQVTGNTKQILALDADGVVHAWNDMPEYRDYWTGELTNDAQEALPDHLTDGTTTVKSIATSAREAAAVDSNGLVHWWGGDWGARTQDFGKPVAKVRLDPDSFGDEFLAIMEDGSLAGGGRVIESVPMSLRYGQVDIVDVTFGDPRNGKGIALDSEGRIHPWGDFTWIPIPDELLNGTVRVTEVASNGCSFAVIDERGRVHEIDGNSDPGNFPSQLGGERKATKIAAATCGYFVTDDRGKLYQWTNRELIGRIPEYERNRQKTVLSMTANRKYLVMVSAPLVLEPQPEPGPVPPPEPGPVPPPGDEPPAAAGSLGS